MTPGFTGRATHTRSAPARRTAARARALSRQALDGDARQPRALHEVLESELDRIEPPAAVGGAFAGG